ncbi:MAG: hypothetical protein WC641_01970 [Patescibacteria group bacterium]
MTESTLKQELEKVLGPVDKFFYSPIWQKVTENDAFMLEHTATIRALVELIAFHLKSLPEECLVDYFTWRQAHENVVLRDESTIGQEKMQMLKDRARGIAKMLKYASRQTEQVAVEEPEGEFKRTTIPAQPPEKLIELCKPSDRPSIASMDKVLESYVQGETGEDAERIFREFLHECDSDMPGGR